VAEEASRQPDEKTVFFEMHRLVTFAVVEAMFG
jgi:hypothetical protein